MIEQMSFLDVPIISDPGRVPGMEPREPEPDRPKGDRKTAQRLRKLADGMQSKIDDKKRPFGSQNWTRKRANQYESRLREGELMENHQAILRALADAHEQGTVPPLLQRVTTRAAVEILYRLERWSPWEETQNALSRMGLTPDTVGEAHRLLRAVVALPDHEGDREMRKLEADVRSMVGRVPGFYPTPIPVIEQMAGYVFVEPGSHVLEPSAGSGSIAKYVRERWPGCVLECVEYNTSLARYLKLSGFTIHPMDFLEFDAQGWDVIMMNPPFEKGQDILHIRHAYALLGEQGVLVAICSESPFFRQRKTDEIFRDWLDEVGAHRIELPPDAFRESGTGAKANILVINKR